MEVPQDIEEDILDRFEVLYQGDWSNPVFNQPTSGKIWKAHREIVSGDVLDHFTGETRLGVRPIPEGAPHHCCWAVLDVDRGGLDRDVIGAANRILEDLGLEFHLESSRSKGFHVWVFTDPPAEVAAVRKILHYCRHELLARFEVLWEHTSGKRWPKVDVFPDRPSWRPGESLPTAVFLPLFGVLKEQGVSNRFLDPETGSPFDDQIGYFLSIRPQDPKRIEQAATKVPDLFEGRSAMTRVGTRPARANRKPDDGTNWARVKAVVDLVELVQDQWEQEGERVGDQIRFECLFHEDSDPSFFVSPHRQLWCCFGCERVGGKTAGGDCFDFIARQRNITKRQALRYLADRAGVPFDRPRRRRRRPRRRGRSGSGTAEERWRTRR